MRFASADPRVNAWATVLPATRTDPANGWIWRRTPLRVHPGGRERVRIGVAGTWLEARDPLEHVGHIGLGFHALAGVVIGFVDRPFQHFVDQLAHADANSKCRAPAKSVKRDDAVTPELVENQHRVRLADRTDLDERSEVPLAVDAREHEALVRREIHLRDFFQRFCYARHF